MKNKQLLDKLMNKPSYIEKLIANSKKTARAILGDGIVNNYKSDKRR